MFICLDIIQVKIAMQQKKRKKTKEKQNSEWNSKVKKENKWDKSLCVYFCLTARKIVYISYESCQANFSHSTTGWKGNRGGNDNNTNSTKLLRVTM